jgi:hypothetical protein
MMECNTWPHAHSPPHALWDDALATCEDRLSAAAAPHACGAAAAAPAPGRAAHARGARARRYSTAGSYAATVAYAGTSSFNNSGNVYPVLGSTGNFAATTVSTVVPTVFNPNMVVLSPTARTGTTTPNYYLVGDALNAYATLTNAATGAPAVGVTVVFTDSACPAPRPIRRQRPRAPLLQAAVRRVSAGAAAPRPLQATRALALCPREGWSTETA